MADAPTLIQRLVDMLAVVLSRTMKTSGAESVAAVANLFVGMTESALVVQPYWPQRRRIPWYRIDQVEVVAESWSLVVELNSGERLALPCVEHVDDLYERVVHHRKFVTRPETWV